MKSNPTEYVVGAILAGLGLFLLYTQYNVGYWGIFALGAIFMVKNWTRKSPGSRVSDREKGSEAKDVPRRDRFV